MKRILSFAVMAIMTAGLLISIPSCNKTTENSIDHTEWTASDSNGQYNLAFYAYQHEAVLEVKFKDAPGYLIRGNYEVNGNRVLITYTKWDEFDMGANLPEFPLKASAVLQKKKLDYIHQQGDIVLDITFTKVK